MGKFPEASALCSLTLFLSPPLDSASCEMCPEDQWPNRDSSQCSPKPGTSCPTSSSRRTSAACPALCSLLTLAIWGIFIGLHHTPLSEPVIPSSATLCCPPWPSVSPSPSCSLALQGPSPVLYARRLLKGHLHNLYVHCAGQDCRHGGSLPWHPATCPDEEVLGPVLPKTIPMVCSLVRATSCSLWVTRWPPRPVTSTEPGPMVT